MILKHITKRQVNLYYGIGFGYNHNSITQGKRRFDVFDITIFCLIITWCRYTKTN